MKCPSIANAGVFLKHAVVAGGRGMLRQGEKLAGNLNTSLLKVLALVFMCFDHFGKMLFPNVLEMRMVGRLAFPIYAWCLVVGACHTRHMGRYALRLLVVGISFQPLYMAALNHTWKEPNIFLTLFLGLSAIAAIRMRKGFSHIWGPILALVLAQWVRCDYGWGGVLLILLLYLARKDCGGICAVMIAFCLFWGASSSTVLRLFGQRLSIYQMPGIGAIAQSFLKLQGLAVLSLPFIVIPMPWKMKMNHWIAYALYPLHLLILWLCQLL